jgi:HSP20 family protein
MENSRKLPVKIEKASPSALRAWAPFESLRREVDRLFDDFDGGFGRFPLRKIETAFGNVLAVDITETEKAYEVTAELPGVDEKNVEVKLAHGVLTIKGQKLD